MNEPDQQRSNKRDQLRIEDVVVLLENEFDDSVPDNGVLVSGPEAEDREEDGFIMVSAERPLKHRPIKQIKEKPADGSLHASGHVVSIAERYTQKGEARTVFFKRNDPLMSQLEAAINGFYRMLIPDCVSSSNVIYDEDKGIVGIASKKIDDFKPVSDDPLTEAEIEEYAPRLARALMASFIYEEEDLHRRNLSKNGWRIDFDMSLWRILYKIKGARDVTGFIVSSPEKAFDIDDLDIMNFPILKKADPFYWPAKTTSFSRSENNFPAEEAAVYAKLKDHPKFIYEKYKTLLKYILIPPEMYRAIASLHIEKDASYLGLNLIDALVESQEKRIEEIKRSLFIIQEFIDLILGPEKERLLQEITEEINAYNKIFFKDKYAAQRIDIAKIEANFAECLETLPRYKIMTASIMMT